MLVLSVVYAISAIVLALFGFNALMLSAVYWRTRKRGAPSPPTPREWPALVVQLPVYNERHVVRRLLESVAALDYPRERLAIQLLDDSDDDTAVIAQAAIADLRDKGLNVTHIRRGTRQGYKAGALAAGLEAAPDTELVVIFDADFAPRPDFLRRSVPHFTADPQLGMVQGRWSHLNADYSPFTRAQALALDSHFAVEQPARQRGGLLMNFSGTAGVWRRICIEDSGGWQGDTLSEDIDLSYRAQLRGWRFLYLPQVDAPAEIPPQVVAFKRQQARWATGTVQCLVKHGRTVLFGPLTVWQRVQATLHLGGYFVHPFLLLLLLSGVALMLTGGPDPRLNLLLAPLGLATCGPLVMASVAQRALYRDWPRRLLYFPFFLLMGMGLTLSNTLAVGRAFTRREHVFRRTPKFDVNAARDGWADSGYALPVEPATWGELALALVAFGAAALGLTRNPALVPFLLLYGCGFAFVGGLGLWQARQMRQSRRGLKSGGLPAEGNSLRP